MESIYERKKEMTYQPTKEQEEQIRKAWNEQNNAFCDDFVWESCVKRAPYSSPKMMKFRADFIAAMLKAGLWSEEGEK